MGLPEINPIDHGWLGRGTPIDHLGTVNAECEICMQQTTTDHYRIILGTSGGLGAPFFVSPFLKRRSTSGKIGGHKGNFSMCRICKSLLPLDESAENALVKFGLPLSGLIDATHRATVEQRSAEQAERAVSAGAKPIQSSRARKIEVVSTETASPSDDVVRALERLSDLYSADVLTEEEFTLAKKKLLNS